MKKSLFIFLGFVILFLPLLTAVKVDLNQEYKQGQPLIAKISGNFLEPILKNNIYFYRDTYTLVPFEFDLLKIDEDYFISTTPIFKTPGNYSLIIKESEHFIEGGQTSKENLAANFSISPEIADFSVKPGVLIANGSFSLELKNLKDTKISVDINKNNHSEKGGFFSFIFGQKIKESIDFNVGEIKQINLEFSNVSEPTLKTVILSTEDFSTEVWVYVFPNDSASLSQSEGPSINESMINVSNPEEENQTSQDNKSKNKLPSITKTCEEVNGTICKLGKEICDGEKLKTANTDSCCLAECVEKEKNPAGKIIGWSMVLILVFLYVWFYLKKYKKTKRKVNLLKVAEGKK